MAGSALNDSTTGGPLAVLVVPLASDLLELQPTNSSNRQGMSSASSCLNARLRMLVRVLMSHHRRMKETVNDT